MSCALLCKSSPPLWRFALKTGLTHWTGKNCVMGRLYNEGRVHIKINQEVRTDIFRISNLHHKQSPSQGRNGRLNQWGSGKAEPHLAS